MGGFVKLNPCDGSCILTRSTFAGGSLWEFEILCRLLALVTAARRFQSAAMGIMQLSHSA